jgi:uncharacterized protein YeaO (DUF488 family)
MAIRVVRLGARRGSGEGPRFGTVRRPPRGVKKEDFSSRDYFDLWLPDLSPTQELVSWAQAAPWTDGRWAAFARKYRAEMRRPEPARLIKAFALLSKQADFSVGCYCEDETRCHRAVLRDLLIEAGADVR